MSRVEAVIQALESLGRSVELDPPTSELSVHQLLRDALTDQWQLSRSEIRLEHGIDGGGFVDIWVESLRLAIEVKFHRGTGRPLTAQFGDILADVKKLARVDAVQRLFFLLTDQAGVTHLRNKGLLRVRDERPLELTAHQIDRLPFSARGRCISDGPWIDVAVTLVWHRRALRNELFAWSVARI